MFSCGCEQSCFFAKWHFLENLQNTLCVRKAKKTRTFIDTICFWKNVIFFWAYKITKHYENRGLSRHKGKPKMALLVWKVSFGKGPRKGFYYLGYTKAVLCWKHSFIVFSAAHSFAEIQGCKLTKKQKCTKIGGCLPACKKVFLLFLLFSFVLDFLEKAPKKVISCNFRGFSSLVPPKGLSLRSFSSSYSFFFLVFLLLSSLSKFHVFFISCPSTPFWKILFGGFFFFLCFLHSKQTETKPTQKKTNTRTPKHLNLLSPNKQK